MPASVLRENPDILEVSGIIDIDTEEDFVNAERIYKQLITAIPDYPEGYYGLGQVYLNMENYAKALEFIQKAKEKYKNLDTKKYFEEAAKKDMYIADCNYLEGQINYRMDMRKYHENDQDR